MPVQVVRKANAAIDKLGKDIQDTAPVKSFDSAINRYMQEIKATLAKTKVGPEIINAIKKYRDFGKESPGKQAIILAIVILTASFAAGPLGGALAGFIMRAGNDLIAGKKASSAIGGAAKAAAIGALVGFGARWLGDAIISNIEMAGMEDVEAMSQSMQAGNLEDVLAGIDAEYGSEIVDKIEGSMQWRETGTINAFSYDYNVFMTAEQLEHWNELKDTVNSFSSSHDPGWHEATARYHEYMASVVNEPDQMLLRQANVAVKFAAYESGLSDIQLDQILASKAANTDLEGFVGALSNANPAIAGAVQAAAQQADQFKAAMHKVGKPEEPETPLPPEMIPDTAAATESIDKDAELYEFDFSGLKRMAGVAAKGTSKAILDIGTVNPKQLMKAWKKAGSPEDTDSIRNILVSLGMSPDVIDTSFANVGVDAPSPDAEAPPGE